jgi:hypothetical protein
MLGFIMLLVSESDHVKYAGTFLSAAGIYSNVPQCTAWNGNNIGGSTKRSVGMAMQVGCGNLGGIISAYMFLTKDAPRFRHGYGALIGFCLMACLLSIFMTFYFRKENASRDRDYKRPQDYTIEEKMLERSKGNDASFFRYTV